MQKSLLLIKKVKVANNAMKFVRLSMLRKSILVDIMQVSIYPENRLLSRLHATGFGAYEYGHSGGYYLGFFTPKYIVHHPFRPR